MMKMAKVTMMMMTKLFASLSHHPVTNINLHPAKGNFTSGRTRMLGVAIIINAKCHSTMNVTGKYASRLRRTA